MTFTEQGSFGVVQREASPRVYAWRTVVDHPTRADLESAIALMQKDGMPEEAFITVEPWNSPPGRYYVVGRIPEVWDKEEFTHDLERLFALEAQAEARLNAVEEQRRDGG